MTLNDVSLGYSQESDSIFILGKGMDDYRIVNQEFYDTLEQVLHGKEYLKINVRGRFFKVRMELV